MNSISGKIVDAALQVVLADGLGRRGFYVERQHPVPIEYDEIRLHIGFGADLLVEDKIIVEVKSVEAIAPVH
jgi:GxxExxY protein